MKTTKIGDEEIKEVGVSSLPTRPNAPLAFGGRGLTAEKLKEAFDALPTLICMRLNMLIDDITGANGGRITDVIPTEITDGHTLNDLFSDITSGAILSYMGAPSGTLATYLLDLRNDINMIASKLGISL